MSQSITIIEDNGAVSTIHYHDSEFSIVRDGERVSVYGRYSNGTLEESPMVSGVETFGPFRVVIIPDAVARMSQEQQRQAIALTGIGRRDECDLAAFIERQAWRTYPTTERANEDAWFFNTRAPFAYVRVGVTD